MNSHRQLSDEAFLSAFADCSLPSELFSHEAHIRLAWIQIKTYGLEQAISNVCSHIVRYVKHLGAEDKYDDQLTIAAVKVVHRFYVENKTDDFNTFMRASQPLKDDFIRLVKAEQNVS